MTASADVVMVAVAASWIFWLVASGATACVLEPRPRAERLPPVSILKPVRGVDFEAWENFVSHCEQRYPAYEIVFGVADARDPVLPMLERLRARYGERVRVVVAPGETPNPKAGLLDRLAAAARHDVLVATDSDVRVEADFLASVVSPLADERVGLVTLPYRGERVVGLAAGFEALGMETSFLPSAVVGLRVMRGRFALGAANAVRREALERIGGFRAVSTYLADDYQLGRRIGEAGYRVVLGDHVVASVLGETSLRDWWTREVRWTRTIRASRRAQYPGLLLTFSTPLALLAAIAGAGWLPLFASLLLRWHVGWEMTRCTGHLELRRWLWLLPVRDVLSAAIWVSGLLGRRVHWRGRAYEVAADGQLRPAEARRSLAARAVVAVDRVLRRRQRIFEFTDDPGCVFRLAIAKDERGDAVGELHLWNEQLPRHADLSWGLQLRARLARSLALLADFVERRSAPSELRLFTAETFLDAGYSVARLDAFARHFGFHVTCCEDGRVASALHRVHARLLRRAFPGPARAAASLRRVRFWITRDELLERHLGALRDGARA